MRVSYTVVGLAFLLGACGADGKNTQTTLPDWITVGPR